MAFTSLHMLAVFTIAATLMASAAMAQSSATQSPAAPSSQMPMSGNPVPSQGWGLPEPPTGWGGIPSANNPTNQERDRARDARAAGSGGFGTGAGWPTNLATTDRTFTVTSPSREMTAKPVPGIDTHPTIEQTPLGVDIIRGPAGQ
jgi:hypothetical protein